MKFKGLRLATQALISTIVCTLAVSQLVLAQDDTSVFSSASSDDSARSFSSQNLGSSATHPRVDVLELSGELRAHDPALGRDGAHGDWFVFSTGDPLVAGGNIQIRRSADMHMWAYAGTVFDTIPAWITEAIPGVVSLWAPEIHEHAGIYYLYYSASRFGFNQSIIALATNTTLDPQDPNYKWVDRGLVAQSQTTNDFNAIDPAIIEDRAGVPYLAFGSYWSGIRMWKLEWPSGKLAPGQAEPLRIADRFIPPNAIEAPAFLYRNGWYYLFVSMDACCAGTNSTYRIAVGRARSPTGPYFDKLGTPLMHSGGTVILSEQGAMFGPGGQSIFRGFIAHHYYDATANGDFRLGIRKIAWSADGWPIIASESPATR
jgi:arabinan endo-1,5-alpha-L-arabinosidase